MKIAIDADHGGFALKENIKKTLEAMGLTYHDFGTNSDDKLAMDQIFDIEGQVEVAGNRSQVLISRQITHSSKTSCKTLYIPEDIGV